MSNCSSPFAALGCWTQSRSTPGPVAVLRDFTPRDNPHAISVPSLTASCSHHLFSTLTFHLSSSSPEMLKAPNHEFKYTDAHRSAPPSSVFVPPAAPRPRHPPGTPVTGSPSFSTSFSSSVRSLLTGWSPWSSFRHPCCRYAAGPSIILHLPALSISAARQKPKATGARLCPSPRPCGSRGQGSTSGSASPVTHLSVSASGSPPLAKHESSSDCRDAP